MANPIDGFQVDPATIRTVGHDLQRPECILAEADGSEAGKALKQAFHEDRATPELMLACGGMIAPWMASVTSGGPDLRNVYIGSLRGTTIPWFRSPAAGGAHGPLERKARVRSGAWPIEALAF